MTTREYQKQMAKEIAIVLLLVGLALLALGFYIDHLKPSKKIITQDFFTVCPALETIETIAEKKRDDWRMVAYACGQRYEKLKRERAMVVDCERKIPVWGFGGESNP